MRVEGAIGADQMAGAGLVALGACVAWASGEYPFGTMAEPGPGLLPFALGIVLAAFGAVLALSGMIVQRERAISVADLPHALLILVVLAAAALAMERFGYRSTVALMLLFFLAVVERRSVVASVATAAAMAFGSFYLINNVLRVPLPVGPWGL